MTTHDILGGDFENFRNLIVSIIPDVDADLDNHNDALAAISVAKNLVNSALLNVKSDLEDNKYISLTRVLQIKDRLTSLNYYNQCIQKVLDEEKKEVLQVLKEIENL